MFQFPAPYGNFQNNTIKKAPTAAKLFYPPTFLFLDYLLKYASLNRIEKAGSITLRKTREGIKEELGMTVKTINRTIAKLKEDGLIDTCKGKVTMDLAQYKRAQEEIAYYVSRHD